jgi:hypothetical protein
MPDVLSWADTHICAAHKGDDGVMHGHTWRVRAYWNYTGASVVGLKALLVDRVCFASLDHQELPDDVRRAEDLAAYIGRLVEAVRVDVWREPEGMGATWTA